MNFFNDWTVVSVNMYYWDSDLIFYTGIWNNNRCSGILRCFKDNCVEFTNICFLFSLFFLSVEWKDIQLTKMSISLSPGENSLHNELKEGNTLFSLLFVSTIDPLSTNCCLDISLLSENRWVGELFVCLDSNSDLMTWFSGSICILSWNLPLSFWK